MSNTDKYKNELIKAIQKHKWMKWAHIDWDALSFSRPTAYNHDLDKLDTIKEQFEQNRSKGRNYLLQKWMLSDNPTLQIAAMRIISDTETHQKLNQQYIDHTTKGDKINKIDLSALNDAELRTLAEMQRKSGIGEA